jgi:hypothetical protein
MRLVEIKTPSEQNLLQQIKDAERELLLLDKDANKLAQLSLTIQVYYLNGGNEEGKKKALNLIAKFKSQYPIKSHFHLDTSGFVNLTERSYQSVYKKAPKINAFEWFLCSTENGETADDYSISIYTARDNYGVSYLHINLPIDLIYSRKGRHEFDTWVKSAVNELEILHGYAGLNIQLPYDRHAYQFYEYGVTRQYWGLTPDGASFFTTDWQEGTRSINWYSFVGKQLKDKLEKQPFYAETLKNSSDIQVSELNDCLIFKAGEIPRLGNKDLPLPLNYILINQLFKIVRSDLPIDAMHTAYKGPRYSLSQVYYWMRRWDNANFDQGIFDFNGKKEALFPVLGQYDNDKRIIPYSGIWTPFDFEGVDQHLIQGNEFPEEAQYEWYNGDYDSKMAVWKLIKRDDGGPVLLPNPF